MGLLESIGGLAGSAISSVFGSSAAKKQAKLQKEFAKNAIQWKMEDAKKAGVHPLAALGATTQSYSPVQVGGGDFTSAGQSLGRAIDAHMDTSERAISKLALEKAGLENEYLRAQIASVRSRINQNPTPATNGPGTQYVISGQGETAIPAVDKTKNPDRLTHLRLPSGVVVATTPGSDAEMFEQRWGDMAQEVYGLNNWYWERGRRALQNYDHKRTMNEIWREARDILFGR